MCFELSSLEHVCWTQGHPALYSHWFRLRACPATVWCLTDSTVLMVGLMVMECYLQSCGAGWRNWNVLWWSLVGPKLETEIWKWCFLKVRFAAGLQGLQNTFLICYRNVRLCIIVESVIIWARQHKIELITQFNFCNVRYCHNFRYYYINNFSGFFVE